MNKQPHFEFTQRTYVMAGLATPLLPSCLFFSLIAAASFASNPWLRLGMLAVITGCMGASIGWFAHRHHHAIEATILTAFFTPPIAYLISVLITQLIEHQLASWGWVQLYDSLGYHIPIQPGWMNYLLFGFTLCVALAASFGVGSGMLTAGRFVFRVCKRIAITIRGWR